MVVPFDPRHTESFYDDYYEKQIGHGLTVFKGRRTQRGHGFFGGLLKSAMPLLKNVGKAVGKRLLSTGRSLATDLFAGKNFKDAVKSRLKDTASDLLGNVTEGLGAALGRKSRKRPAPRRGKGA